MRALRRFFARTRNLTIGRCKDERLREEIEHHLALQAEENLRAGLQPDQARRKAAIKLGSPGAIREQYHAEEGLPFLELLLQDSLYAMRRLRRAPGFTAVVVLTLTLGIGANTAIFSVVRAILLRPLAYEQPDRLVSLVEDRPASGIKGSGFSYSSLLQLQQNRQLFSAVTGLAAHALVLTGHGEPLDLSTIAVTPGFSSVFLTRPLLGRALLDEDGQPGAAPVAVLSEGLWRNRLGGDPHIAGTQITLDKRAYTVVGVMPDGFRTPFFNRPEQVWIPLEQDPLFGRWIAKPPQTHWLLPIVGRLQQGTSLNLARAELKTFSEGLAAENPNENGWTIDTQPLQQAIAGDFESPLLVLLCAVGLVLAIACANIANLLLAQATSRSKEMAIRIAVGASQARIARQLLTESAILGALGGAAGTLLAWRSIPALLILLPPNLPGFHDIHVDAGVLVFALVLSVASSLAFGTMPALHAGRSDPQTSLREGTGAGEARKSRHMRSILAAGEIALATVLLCGAGLMLRSFAHLLSVGPGFEASRLVKAEISLPRYEYSTPRQWSDFANQLLTRLEARPGLRDTAIGIPMPILDTSVNLPFSIAGAPPRARGDADTADYVSVSPNYFRVMSISLAQGRTFSSDDSASAMPVAIISESLAKRYFSNQNPLGRSMIFGFPPDVNVSREIVGVVSDVRDISLTKPPGPAMYVPFAQAPFWGAEVVVRSNLSTAAIVDAIRSETRGIDSSLPVSDIESLPEALSASLTWPRFRTALLAGFGGMALLLAAIGIYGVVSFSVSRRTREIGVRIAMGAAPSNVRRLVLKESAALALAGLAVGIPVSLALMRLLSALLFGVSTYDPFTFATVVLLLVSVTLTAAWIPAGRAAAVDPVVALRSE